MGNKLRELRTERGLKAKEVAMFLEITERAYYHYEQDKRDPSIDIIKKLCRFFEVSADYLLGLSDY